MKIIHLALLVLPSVISPAFAEMPTTNPAAGQKLPWTAELKWGQVIDISAAPGANVTEKLAAAQKELAGKGGGVVYFPPGEYRFEDSISLADGIVLRGADPTGGTNALKDSYALGSRLEFPKYEFKGSGDGTPIDTAFKVIQAANPENASNTGLVNLAINRGHILLGQAEDGTCGKNRMVYGCILRNTATADPGIPDKSIGQKPWQRHTWRFGAAIEVKSAENLLIANNRLSKSGDDDFKMDSYVVKGKKSEQIEMDGVPFDYDNRPGIYANHESLGGQGGQGPDGTPETHPLGFRKGVVIRGNYVYSTGRCAIGFSGDGTICSDNVIRFAKDVWRPTATGRDMTSGASTNDNRAMEMRGWRWNVSDNDYEVYRNISYDRNYPINDGEGLMHEDHANSTIKDSVLSGNRGNAYLSMYKTAGIDGLLVEDNEIRIPGSASAIASVFVMASRNSQRFPVRNVIIRNNVTNGTILIEGDPGSGNVVEGNRYEGTGTGTIKKLAAARIGKNQGFEVVTKK